MRNLSIVTQIAIINIFVFTIFISIFIYKNYAIVSNQFVLLQNEKIDSIIKTISPVISINLTLGLENNIKEIVNDGTYPHEPLGTLMMPAGAIGYIKSIGEFLQVIRVYEVHFLGVESTPVEIVGCREHELEAMEDFRDEVQEELEWMRKHREKYYSKN